MDGDRPAKRVRVLKADIRFVARRALRRYGNALRYLYGRLVVLKVTPRRPRSVVRRPVLYLLIDVSSGHLRDRKLCPGCIEQ